MKLVLSSVIALGLATTAFAGNSDRYNDLRLNTAVGHVTSHDTARTTPVQAFRAINAPVRVAPQDNRVRISTRNATARTPYAYQNPHGVGPDNDSR